MIKFTSDSSQKSLLLVALAVLLTAMTTACAVVEPQVKAVIVNDQLVDQASTNVELERAGVRSPVTPGTTLEEGDIIRTGANATAVLLLENGAIEIFMLENTEIHISSIWMELGEIYVKTKRKLREVFEIESDYGTATYEGTVFAVRVENNPGSSVVYECTTLEGTVVVRSPDNAWRPIRVEAGNTAVVNQGSQVTSRALSRDEFNDFIDRINKVERTFRPGSSELVTPDLVGLTHAEAQREASKRGIQLGNPVETVTGQVAVGQIATQNPVPGGLIRRAGTAISIEIEVAPATVPNVTGDTIETAQRKLTAANLKAGRVTEEPALSGTFDRVIEQSQSAGSKVVPETVIDLVIAVQGASVPSVTGVDRGTAQERLDKAGLQLGRVRTERGRGDVGEVIEQDPGPREVVEQGSRVDIVIEEGCTVPMVRGDQRAAAYQKIRSAGFTPTTNATGSLDESVAGTTNPGPGAKQSCGSNVRVDFERVVQ